MLSAEQRIVLDREGILRNTCPSIKRRDKCYPCPKAVRRVVTGAESLQCRNGKSSRMHSQIINILLLRDAYECAM